MNSTMKALGKRQKGIIATPEEDFLVLPKQHSSFQRKGLVQENKRFQGTGAEAVSGKAKPYNYNFDKTPI